VTAAVAARVRKTFKTLYKVLGPARPCPLDALTNIVRQQRRRLAPIHFWCVRVAAEADADYVVITQLLLLLLLYWVPPTIYIYYYVTSTVRVTYNYYYNVRIWYANITNMYPKTYLSAFLSVQNLYHDLYLGLIMMRYKK